MINIDGVAIELRPRPFFQKALILSLSGVRVRIEQSRPTPFPPKNAPLFGVSVSICRISRFLRSFLS
ncbi:MAG: hypothetical protein DWI02_05390 [Planctomycetota bacterium]|nr:MAG: hypothetical protein DWI02_05390 [Planctomycetota bacterium]